MSADPLTLIRLRAGSPEAAAVAWPWRDAAPAIAANLRQQQRRALRREGLIRALVGGAAGAVLFYFGAGALARVAWIVAGAVLLAALASPEGLYKAIGRALASLGHGIGRLFAILFLTPVFFLVFLPFGRLLRSGRRDKLERWFDKRAPSYWHRRNDVARTKASFEKAY